MYRAGTVVGAAQGVTIVRCPDERHPDLGSSLVDETLATVGTVVDIIGPVGRPYLVVSPEEGTSRSELLGMVLYAREE